MRNYLFEKKILTKNSNNHGILVPSFDHGLSQIQQYNKTNVSQKWTRIPTVKRKKGLSKSPEVIVIIDWLR